MGNIDGGLWDQKLGAPHVKQNGVTLEFWLVKDSITRNLNLNVPDYSWNSPTLRKPSRLESETLQNNSQTTINMIPIRKHSNRIRTTHCPSSSREGVCTPHPPHTLPPGHVTYDACLAASPHPSPWVLVMRPVMHACWETTTPPPNAGLACDLWCMLGSQPPLPVDRQTPVKTLLCPGR